VVIVRRIVAASAAAAAIWGAGLAWFICVASRDIAPIGRADAIVALTGGPDRVEVALKLLAHGVAGKLLISGAGERTGLGALAHLAGIDTTPLEQQITVGHAAHDTRGNAMEVASWTRDHDVDSVFIVTAWFHMPRALLELRRAMPNVRTYPYPVGRFSIAAFNRGGLARRVIEEYHKYLAALAGFGARPSTIDAAAREEAG
jgi:uncharacterized SAM-binding protein YcdF (DUF218 family)